MKENLVLLCLLITVNASISASDKILGGKVLDANTHSPIEYANVMLLDKDSAYITGCVSDAYGTFAISEIPANAVIVKMSFLGYIDALYRLADIDIQKENVFTLSPTSVSLNEVTVTANRRPFVIKDEKILFDPTFISHAVNASDIIKQAPGVMDTGTSLVMPGKDAIKVFINGKEQKGTLNDVMLLLKSYPAKDVEAVEVLPNPSTRYTMGRNVGVVNLKIKKRPNDYIGGNASYLVTANEKISHEITAGWFYQGKRISTSLNVVGEFKRYKMEERNNLNFSDYVRYANADMSRRANNYVLRWNLDYKLGENWNTSLSAYLSDGTLKHKANHEYSYDYADGNLREVLMSGKRTDKTKTYFASYDIDGKLSQIAHLSVTIDYFHKDTPTERAYALLPENLLTNSSYNNISSNNVTAKANVSVIPNKKLNMNFGVDGMLTNSEDQENALYEDGVEASNTFQYREKELDVFGEARYKINAKWMLRGSIRYQNVWTITQSGQSKEHKRHYALVAPSAYLSYYLPRNQSLQLGFYYNINKPTLTMLNPAEFYIGNDTYRQGNSNLEQSRHYVVNLTYSLGNLLVQPYIEWLKGAQTEISYLQDDKYQIMTWENAVDRRNIGVMVFWSYSKLKWMRASVSAFGINPTTTSNHPLLQSSVSTFKLSFNPNLQIYLEQSRKWILAMYGNFTSSEHTVDVKMKAMWRVNSSLTWRPDSKWTIVLSGLNLLHSNTRGEQYIGGSTMKFNNRYMYRSAQLSVSYSFGKSMRRMTDRAVLREMNTRTELDN